MAFEPLLPIGLGFAGGAMLWMVFSELVPDALEETRSNLVAVVVTLAVAAMTFLFTTSTQGGHQQVSW